MILIFNLFLIFFNNLNNLILFYVSKYFTKKFDGILELYFNF